MLAQSNTTPHVRNAARTAQRFPEFWCLIECSTRFRGGNTIECSCRYCLLFVIWDLYYRYLIITVYYKTISLRVSCGSESLRGRCPVRRNGSIGAVERLALFRRTIAARNDADFHCHLANAPHHYKPYLSMHWSQVSIGKEKQALMR